MPAVLFALILVLFGCSVAQADLTLSGQYDYFASEKKTENKKLLLSAELGFEVKEVRFYAEAFADYQDSLQGYFQEAYADYSFSNYLFRVGKQALRWSEMWTIPSLDYWTGRRWNRMFFDSFRYQLHHPVAAVFTRNGEVLSYDLVASQETSQDIYPENVPVSSEKNSQTDYGARLRMNLGSLQTNLLYANIEKNEKWGLSGNYAFELLVLKAEYGETKVKNQALSLDSQSFYILGSDIFIGDFTIMPQISFIESAEILGSEQQVTYYLSASYQQDENSFMTQAYLNDQTRDLFLNFNYTRAWNNNLSSTFYIQRFESSPLGIYSFFPVTKDEWIYGVSVNLSEVISF